MNRIKGEDKQSEPRVPFRDQPRCAADPKTPHDWLLSLERMTMDDLRDMCLNKANVEGFGKVLESFCQQPAHQLKAHIIDWLVFRLMK